MRFFNKGNISNLITFLLMVGGWAAEGQAWPAASWVFATGLFGFAGGVTNWLAVKMLFDRVPLLYGSGVIPNRFKEIRRKVKELIMRHFFAEDYLQRYVKDGFGLLPDSVKVEGKLRDLIASPEMDLAIERQLENLPKSTVGSIIMMVGIDFAKGLVKNFLEGMVGELTPKLMEQLKSMGPDVSTLRGKVDQMLTAKLEELTPDTVKKMMEDVMREHLGWLIVWGNVFGGLIGVLSRFLGYR